MILKIDQEFKNLIPPLTYDERTLLEKNIVKEGCRDPIVVWDNTIIDGHNRYDICNKNDLEYKISEVTLKDRNEVINWIIDNQLGKRNISAQIRLYLIGKRYQNEKKVIGRPTVEKSKIGQNDLINNMEQLKPTASKIAEQTNVSEATVKRAESFAESVDKIAKISGKSATTILKETKVTQEEAKNVTSFAPEVQKDIVDKVMSGEVKSFKEAFKPILEKELKQKYTPEQLEEKFPSKCSFIPFIPKKSDINMCPCKKHGYCDINEIWYNIEQINKMEN